MSPLPFDAPPPIRAADTSDRWQWDVFCRVIDNFGDIGVCWRLAAQLAARGHAVRLWVDDASALAWMAPQGAPGVQVRPWGGIPAPGEPASDVLVEGFGCELPAAFVAACAAAVDAGAPRPAWINLEYLSAEPWVPRHHGLPSPVLHGPASGWTKYFYYPGFAPGTGGLLREDGLEERRQAFGVGAWRAAQADGAAAADPEETEETEETTDTANATRVRWVSLFCYEPPALGDWLAQCRRGGAGRTRLLVTAGRAQAAVRAQEAQNSNKNGSQRLSSQHSLLSIEELPSLDQAGYDRLLWSCDLNFVRGEDSLVRALWAGRALVWHIYPQDDGAHAPKLTAFLDWLQAPASLRHFHAVWNGLAPGALPEVAPEVLAEWTACVRQARQRALAQPGLLDQLLGFCASKR